MDRIFKLRVRSAIEKLLRFWECGKIVPRELIGRCQTNMLVRMFVSRTQGDSPSTHKMQENLSVPDNLVAHSVSLSGISKAAGSLNRREDGDCLRSIKSKCNQITYGFKSARASDWASSFIESVLRPFRLHLIGSIVGDRSRRNPELKVMGRDIQGEASPRPQ